MGQITQKMTGKGEGGQVKNDQLKKDVEEAVNAYIEEHKDFDTTVKTPNGFYHVVYEIVQKLGKKYGAMQLTVPPFKTLEDVYNKKCSPGSKMNKKKFSEIIQNIISFESFHFGQGARDILLFLYGFPVAALLAKRLIPGPTQSISEEILIPMATAGSVLILAQARKL